MKVPIDTGVLLGAVDTDDRHHERCVQVVSQHVGQLLAPALVVAETAWMIEATLGPEAEAHFVDSVAHGEIEVIDLGTDDYGRCADLIRTYADLGLGLVDASVVVVAERLGLTTVATLNHRDFRVVRPRHVAAFELIP